MERDSRALGSAAAEIGKPHHIAMTSPVEEPPGTRTGVIPSDNYENSRASTLCQCKIRKMYAAAFCCLLMAVSMGFAAGYSAPATYHMKKTDLNPSDDSITWIGSILALGAMTGGLIGGGLADKFGRRGSLLQNVFVFLLGWISIIVSPSIIPIIFGRFICGVACGVISVAVPMYCVEISTPEVRGLLGTLFQTFIVTGSLFCTIIGYYVSWEYLAVSGACMAGLAFACFAGMPESPKFWLAKGDRYRALKVILALQGDHLDANKECERIYSDLQSQPKGRLTFEECSNPIVYKPALLTVGLMFFQQFSGSNAVLFYSTEIFDANKDFMDPRKATIILGAIQVVATILSNLLVDRIGRKVLLCLSGAIMCISQVGLGVFYYESVTHGLDAKVPWIPLLSICVFIVAFSIGFGPIPWLLAAEMVPLRARSTIGGVATFANGLFAFVITKTFAQLLSFIHNYGAFVTYGAISCVSCFFVLLFIPETKGKETEEISNFFRKVRTGSAEMLEEVRTVSFITINRDALIGGQQTPKDVCDTSSQDACSKPSNETCNEPSKNVRNETHGVLNNEQSKDVCKEPPGALNHLRF